MNVPERVELPPRRDLIRMDTHGNVTVVENYGISHRHSIIYHLLMDLSDGSAISIEDTETETYWLK